MPLLFSTALCEPVSNTRKTILSNPKNGTPVINSSGGDILNSISHNGHVIANPAVNAPIMEKIQPVIVPMI